MSEEKRKPEDDDDDQPDVEEVVTDFGDVRVRSGFEIDQHEPGVLGINLFGPIFEFDDDDDLEVLDLEDEEDNQESHEE